MTEVCDLYGRVSTDLQAEEGYSLQEQEERLRMYAAAQGWKIHKVYLDGGYSGASLDRPGIRSVIQDAEMKRITKVVTYKLDRLSRSQKDTLYLIEDVFLANGVDYVSVTESLDTGTPFGMAMIGILSVFAQLERQQIAERMMMGRVAAAKEGKWRGGSGVPIGYRYVPRTATEPGRLIVNDYEAAQVREVFQLFLAGKTFHAIYAHMQAAGYTTAYGKFASGGAARIPAMLTNRAYIGEIKYQGIWYPGTHPAIIDRETFNRAQAVMAEYRASLDANKRKPFCAKRQLTGLLWCAECGARMSHTYSHYRTRSGEYVRYEFYRCYTRANNKRMKAEVECKAEPWRASELEDIVWDQVEALTFDSAVNQSARAESPVAAYEERVAEIDKQLDRLIQLFSLGSLPFDAIQKQSAKLTEERGSLVAAIDAANKRAGKLTRSEVEDALLSASEIRRSGDEAAKRDLLVMLISRIEVGQDSIKIEWNI